MGNFFLTIGLLAIFGFILQVLFKNGLQKQGDVTPGISEDYYGYEGSSPVIGESLDCQVVMQKQ